ncbi:protein of unknown function (plasmid) [Cupriavidus taiwanensis]|uniref:Uncharacterized protein n=1 Tax=Cupriavidus taiwanensis TaxID=164546 RepID=A0A7Z7JGN8_9BURK|nr:protein of unknown function [Cupriavidus taiwanensis]SPD54837.1 protein of unknown function [Cupriavidus taiwanensis]
MSQALNPRDRDRKLSRATTLGGRFLETRVGSPGLRCILQEAPILESRLPLPNSEEAGSLDDHHGTRVIPRGIALHPKHDVAPSDLREAAQERRGGAARIRADL